MNAMRASARAYIGATLAIGVLLLGGMLVRFQIDPFTVAATTVVAAIASIAQLLKVEGPTRKSSYSLSLVAYGFALVLLGVPEAALVMLAASLVEWAWYRYPWYIQSFNIGALVISLTAASTVLGLVPANVGPRGFGTTIGIMSAGAVFVFTNHLLVGLVIWLARGEDFRESGIFDALPLAIDVSLLGLGAGAAFVWQVNAWAALLALPPLYLLYATMRIPSLERQAVTDSKTGLYNARFFNDALARELERADRYDRPLTVVMADLDLLRNINNTYGHIAGDLVLKGVADVLAKSVREYDIVSRVGGEEFAILMGETSLSEAVGHVEQMRAAIEAAGFDVPTSVEPVRATMSFGISERRVSGSSVQELIHNADLALYQSKVNGRNCVCIAAETQTQAVDHRRATEPDMAEARPSLVSIDAHRQTGVHSRTAQDDRFIGSAPELPSRVTTRASVATSGNPVHTVAPSKRAWLVDGAIAAVGVAALVATAAGVRFFGLAADMGGLLLFTCVTALAESLSIDIHVRDASVSTSAAPFIAGALLFGPMGVVCMSAAAAVAACIKHRSPLSRLVYNLSSHVVAGMLAIGLAAAMTGVTGTGVWQMAVSALAVAMAVFVVTTLLVSVIIGLTTDQSPARVWPERFQWLAPHYVALGAIALAFILGYQRSGVLGALIILAPMLVVRFGQEQYVAHAKRMVGELRSSNNELARRSAEIDFLNQELLQVLSDVVDLRDPYVLGHAQRVADYAALIALEMGFTEERTETLRKAALLHDIGKLGIPEAILFKPSGLTDEEFEVMKHHAELGADIIGHSTTLSPILPAVLHHHERWDGKGYPHGIGAQAIPLEARILALADAVEAMASDRPYCAALDTEEILAEIERCSDTQFDRTVVDTFAEIVRREGSGVIVNSAVFVDASHHPRTASETLLENLRVELSGVLAQGCA